MVLWSLCLYYYYFGHGELKTNLKTCIWFFIVYYQMAALASSGPIQLSEIQAIMGGSGSARMSDYTQNASTYYARGVPGITNADLKLSAFYGKHIWYSCLNTIL